MPTKGMIPVALRAFAFVRVLVYRIAAIKIFIEDSVRKCESQNYISTLPEHHKDKNKERKYCINLSLKLRK